MLPGHIIQVSEKWYKNTTNGKFIHKNNIEVYLNQAAAVKTKKREAKNASVKYKKNIKAAFRRWNDD